MKNKINLCVALGFATILSTINPEMRTFAGDGDDQMVEQTISPDPVVLGGRIRKVIRGKERIYLTIEINNQSNEALPEKEIITRAQLAGIQPLQPAPTPIVSGPLLPPSAQQLINSLSTTPRPSIRPRPTTTTTTPTPRPVVVIQLIPSG